MGLGGSDASDSIAHVFSSVVLRGIFCFWETACLAFCAPLCVFICSRGFWLQCLSGKFGERSLLASTGAPGAGTPRAPGRAKAGTLASSDARAASSCKVLGRSSARKLKIDLQCLRRTGAGGVPAPARPCAKAAAFASSDSRSFFWQSLREKSLVALPSSQSNS